MNPRQRALTRQYKEAPPKAGVFVIRNLVDARVYIGSGLNVEGAMNRTRFELARKSHRNAPLLAHWTAHGPENFVFEVIDTIKPRDEPGFDIAAELAEMLDLWRAEYRNRGEREYDANTPPAGQHQAHRSTS